MCMGGGVLRILEFVEVHQMYMYKVVEVFSGSYHLVRKPSKLAVLATFKFVIWG